MTLYQVDSFTDQIFKGNPAGVIPLSNWLPEDLMQKIAMENNLSETAFFVPVEDGFHEASFHIRWFTPNYEIDLCGHATLASAFIIKEHLLPSVKTINFLTEKAGQLRVTCEEGKYSMDFPSRMPQPCEIPKELFPSLGITEAVEVLKSRDYFVVLKDEVAIKNLNPDFNLMSKLDTIGVIVTAPGTSADFVSRCFYPGAGIPEDSVTGSAHCNIIPYWSQKTGMKKFFAKQLSERGGDIWCEFKGERVLIIGTAVSFLKAEIQEHKLEQVFEKLN